MSTLDEQLDERTRALLRTYHFDALVFEQLRGRLLRGHAEDAENRVVETLGAPLSEDIGHLPAPGTTARSALHAVGAQALAAGRVAVGIMAGGMATRFGGVVKAGAEVIAGKSFLQLKLRDLERQAALAGSTLPVVIMTSFATDEAIRALLSRLPTAGLQIALFSQFVSLRLSPEGALFRDRAGALSPYATGHGDLVPALRHAGVLQRLRAAGVEQLFVSNVDNLAATLDPAVIGAHLTSGMGMTFEVSPLQPGDKGGVPARLAGRLQVIEALRYPVGFDESSIPWFSTNSLVFALAQIDRELPLSWFGVRKQVEGRPAVQFERFVNQATAFVPSRALAIARDGEDSRFLPVKDPEELHRRLPQIEAVLKSRGLI